MKPIEFFLALRFLREGRSQTLLIFSGATAGVAVIVFLTSLIVGLQDSLVEQIMGLQPHIVVEPIGESEPPRIYEPEADEYVFTRTEPRPGRIDEIGEWATVVETIAATPELVAVSPVAFGPASAVRGQILEPIEIRGIDPATYNDVIEIEGRLVSGEYEFEDQGTIIGVDLADELGVDVGDRVRFVTAEEESHSFTVRGIFDVGASGPNQSWVYVSLREAQSMLDLSEGVTAIQVTIDDLFDADDVAERLDLYVDHELRSWQETNEDLLRALRTQSASTILIAVFVAISVALGIASVLVVTVVQKRGQVGVLRAMGGSMGTILRVFLIQGATVGLVGSIFGSVLGTALALGFNNFVRDEQGEVIFPIEPSPTIFVMACLLATLTGLLAAVVPARRAARMDPADAIKNA